MSTKKMLVLVTLLIAATLLTACAGAAGEAGPAGPAGPEGPAGPAGADGADADLANLSCAECHNETHNISAKVAAQGNHPHTTGRGWSYAGGRASCTGCHSGASFPDMVASGVIPDAVESVTDVAPIDCRTCHQVHTTYTADDWALTVDPTTPANLYAFEDVTFDGGSGNLCATCHMPRRAMEEANEDGTFEITSTHWGPHHGPQSAVMLGVGGAGPEAEGKPGAHYSMIENTCVSCHLGDDSAHTFAPTPAACQGCHADIEELDFSGYLAETEEKLATLLGYLEEAGPMADGHPNPGVYPYEQAQAAWNYIMLSYEDNSSGAHNPAYATALLDWSLAVFE